MERMRRVLTDLPPAEIPPIEEPPLPDLPPELPPDPPVQEPPPAAAVGGGTIDQRHALSSEEPRPSLRLRG